MEKPKTIYTPEKEKKHLSLTQEQKDSIRNITLGIEEVDEAIREMAIPDVIHTLENGHPLNRVIADPSEGATIGYIACEDFVPHEAYIKYFGTSGQTGRSLLREIPAFLEYAKNQGYTKLNFHGWNNRLNHVLERYGFQRLRTDSMGDLSADFYEKTLVEQKSPRVISEERKRAFEDKYLIELSQKYQQTLTGFSVKAAEGETSARQKKEREITAAFQTLSSRLTAQPDFAFGPIQQAVLKLKLARHFQNNDTVDLSTLFDAITESPKFITTDKGSLHRLLEVHEEKTLQKIAEIRKQRAEMTGNEAFNPYENLFTTTSGKYYMVRLLNMPHLEEESAYMNHCVGTSDSYVNQIKRGEIEILSFRHVPSMNPVDQKFTEDVPMMTIEYNLKTQTIEQMKKANDAYLSPNDAYFGDVIDALKRLRTTHTDSGQLRDFKKIASSELENFKVQDYHLLTKTAKFLFVILIRQKVSLSLKWAIWKLRRICPSKTRQRLLSWLKTLIAYRRTSQPSRKIYQKPLKYTSASLLQTFSSPTLNIFTAHSPKAKSAAPMWKLAAKLPSSWNRSWKVRALE